MNEERNQNQHSDRDRDIVNALATLPDPPPHRDGFWADLDSGLGAESGGPIRPHRRQSPQRPHSRGRGSFLLVAAAALCVVGAIGFGLSNRTPNTIEATRLPSSLESAVRTTTSLPPETDTTTPSDPARDSDSGQATSTTAVAAPVSDQARSDLFHYHVEIPDGFVLDFASGRGVSISHPQGPLDANLQTINYRLEDEWSTHTSPYSTEEQVGASTVTVPLLDRTSDGGLVDNGVVLEVQQFHYQDDERHRWVRTYIFADRAVIAELVYNDEALLDGGPEEMLDGIRMENAAFEPIQGCSSEGFAVTAPPVGLNPAQGETYSLILQALNTCEWNLLAELTSGEFTASFGGSDAIELWQDAEFFGEPILARLYEHLVGPFAQVDGIAQWPRAAAYPWEEVDDDMKNELNALGYNDLSVFEDIGYVGYRTGIDTEGNWIYFVAGD